MSKGLIKTPEEIELMRECGRIVADVLKLLEKSIKPGITTKELDEIAEEYIRSQCAEPAFKGYGTDKKNLYPASLCTSIDDQVVHGIPGQHVLSEGEIISIDIGVKKDNYHGDGAKSFAVGRVSEEKLRLLKVTEESLYLGIAQATAGNRVQDISAAIQKYVEKAGFSVVRDLVGHGIGRSLHEEPPVPNYVADGSGMVLKSGMTLAIEPMINAGSYKVKFNSDGWTVTTTDGKPSAHFEHTVLITDSEPEILTK
ncbi:MAG: type I methionyl aminopeptidase [Bacteroidota bacterium]|nr:type I methionyl aminopeptidase [Bacteroidota bacterium]